MSPPAGWQNPIIVQPGQVQKGVDPLSLLPARPDLERVRVELQRALLLAGTPRFTSIQVTPGGAIYDGHHAIRAAAEEGRRVDVLVVGGVALPSAASIMALPVR
jgi:hypothetical protein